MVTHLTIIPQLILGSGSFVAACLLSPIMFVMRGEIICTR